MLDDGSLKLLIPEPCLQYSRDVSGACYAARTRVDCRFYSGALDARRSVMGLNGQLMI
jgi:hypothetical protein